ncbi:MAG TPA: amino acid ABC transporter permease [Amaricoccus sp.]|uniref:amino acid ABC transporter permease n=1 Tax=Amaricoccus sp. TaxID=1872485 RepID=UPI002C39DCA1|nr:amino acid ABC transporter permease [Amaricoccus sp.]HPG21481.1 amino acid ABC transporter permease [Amaricoccus sp.]HRW14453.1 amino acid ABC transporter permease [Amaricoccus sp.]
MQWLYDPANIALLAKAFLMTLMISTIVIVGSNLLALPLAIYLQKPAAPLRRIIIAYSFFARAAPVLAILFVLYYGLPRLGIFLEPVPSAIIGLVFASTAYNLEFLRSGFEGIPDGQTDGAHALGLTSWQVYRKILIPQAYAASGPALFSNAIQMVKGSSLASLVAVNELTAASTTLIAETYRAIEILTFVGALYGLIAAVIIGLQWLYERSLGWQHLRR